MTDENNKTIKTSLPGPSLDQEKKATKPGAEKPRVMYSGAARRRFKKEQRKLGAEQAQGTSAPELGVGGGGGSKAQEGKRPAPEHDTPSPQSRRPDKISKLASGTYAQAATKMVRWALVPESYPEQRLTPEDIGSLKGLLRSQILSLKEGTRAPKFEGVWERDGAAVVGCTDEESGTWLKSLFPGNKIGGRLIRVLHPEELPKRNRVVIHVDEVVSAREATARAEEREHVLTLRGSRRRQGDAGSKGLQFPTSLRRPEGYS
ncbi:hypothetical protein PV328_011933 [Microctonus aethiopoides]|uniref:DUF4780 domain-containing protein n=1 Tax=Microctonus aethiopoides TaxID=144406 RepID=A0AA39C448_9HYME|nr:hypothetical protein PV328_011933 [Microctonus aethiopoides]